MNAGQVSMTNALRNAGDTTTGLVRYAGMAKGNATKQVVPQDAAQASKVATETDEAAEFAKFLSGLKVGLDGSNNLRGVPTEGKSFTFAGTKSSGGGGREYFSFPKPTAENKPAFARMMLAGRKYDVSRTRALAAAVFKAAGIPVVFGNDSEGGSDLNADAV